MAFAIKNTKPVTKVKDILQIMDAVNKGKTLERFFRNYNKKKERETQKYLKEIGVK